MPPKAKFDRGAIVEAAFAIAREEGFAGITTRSMAKHLRCSVEPIYLNFETIEDLIKAVVERVFALSDKMLKKTRRTGPFRKYRESHLSVCTGVSGLFS